MFLKFTLSFLALTLTTTSFAKIFKFDLDMNPNIPQEVQNYFRAELTKVEDNINKGLPGADSPDRLMEGMANSSVMSGKGVGSDYASNMSVVLIGAGVGVGVDAEKQGDSDISGIGLQGGLILGTNFSWLDTETILGLDTNKLNMYVNYSGFNFYNSSDDTTGSLHSRSYGVHFSYQWKAPTGNSILGWGGVKFHWGYEYNNMRIKLNSTIKEEVSTTYESNDYIANVNANPFATIDVATSSIPLEISTSAQFLYFLSLYTGLGVDYNMGSATGKGVLNSTPSEITCSGDTCPAGSLGTVTTQANIDGKARVTPFLMRGFVGAQVNLPFVRIFVQGDKAFGNDLVGATAGVRFVY
jgi:hypothetical protein